MKITGFQCFDMKENPLKSDSFGNNTATSCPECTHPILFVALENQKGSGPSHKTKCKGCNVSLYIEVDELKKKIIIKN